MIDIIGYKYDFGNYTNGMNHRVTTIMRQIYDPSMNQERAIRAFAHEQKRWLKENLGDDPFGWAFSYSILQCKTWAFFVTPEDATLFKLSR